MIVNVDLLPDSASEPLLLSLQLEAIATVAENLGNPRCVTQETVLAEYEKHMRAAKAALLLGDFQGLALHNNPKSFRVAARNMWTIGLLQLQKAIAEGTWTPANLDLSSKPENDPLLTFKLSSGGLSAANL